MVNCKLCHQERTQSTSDPKMCSRCYADLTKYRRLIVKPKEALTPGNKKFVAYMEAMFDFNKATGGYVPRAYCEESYDIGCATCGKSFSTVVNTMYCNPCKAKERAFRALHAKNPDSMSLDFYYAFYKVHAKDGRKVPQLWYELYGKTLD